jgi:hypothetical protein
VVSARVNLLTKTEQFNDAIWTKTVAGTGTTPIVTDGYSGAVAPDGTFTASRLQAFISGTSSGDISGLQRGSGATVATLSARVWLKSNTGASQTAWFRAGGGERAVTITSTWAELTDSGITDYFSIGLRGSISGAGSLDILLWHPDQRTANIGVGLPAYQRVNTSTDYDSTGFPIYIKPNGSNQFMQTNSINFSATDKMTVWQGVRKLSDAAAAINLEFSASATANTGAFYMSAPNDASTQRYGFYSNGTGTVSGNQASYVTGTGAAPDTAVLTGISNIAGDSSIIRRNGTAFAAGTADQGTGNYGNYPAYFYMRAGTSLPFNGNDYGSIARGAASTAAQITAGETYINSLTKAFTP